MIFYAINSILSFHIFGFFASLSHRSPGKILNINIPTFEALTQFGTASIAVKNVGKLEASYGLTVCILNYFFLIF